jgi:hypothetical protein
LSFVSLLINKPAKALTFYLKDNVKVYIKLILLCRMGLFKEEEVLDLTKLEKRGILKEARKMKESDANTEDYVDFSSKQESSNVSNPLGFLDSLASTGASNASTSTNVASEDLQHLKVKFEDLEYKLDRFVERLAALEEKIKGEG